jgi:hypothetical protein
VSRKKEVKTRRDNFMKVARKVDRGEERQVSSSKEDNSSSNRIRKMTLMTMMNLNNNSSNSLGNSPRSNCKETRNKCKRR